MLRRPRSLGFLMRCDAVVALLLAALTLSVAFTDLRKVEGTSFGGYASVDAVNCRDSERH